MPTPLLPASAHSLHTCAHIGGTVVHQDGTNLLVVVNAPAGQRHRCARL